MKIKEGDEWRTALNIPVGQFEYLVMPFSLQGEPRMFMNLINKELHKYLFKGVTVYLDDLLMYSCSYQEHVKLVRELLKALYQNKLLTKFSKCEFHKTEVDFPGYYILGEGG